MSTTKFLFLYRAPAEASQTAMAKGWKPSPEEMQAMYAAWSAWKANFAEEIIDTGDGLKQGGAAAVYKAGTVSDGPFVEGKEVMGGYTFVRASSLERALEIAKECPIIRQPGASIEIRELASY
ncbi:MAG TPA: YciI family protein [Polyangiaceae bacterium]